MELFLLLISLAFLAVSIFAVLTDRAWLCILATFIALISCTMADRLYSRDSNDKPKINQTVVLFDNGNNKTDTLVFEGDTIHVDENNIW